MKFIGILKKAFSAYSQNLTTFLLATLCATAGSTLIVTAPPLLFGLYYMGYKAAKNEPANVKDLLYGFKFFLSSWLYIFTISGIVIVITSVVYTTVMYLNMEVVLRFIIVTTTLACSSIAVVFLVSYSLPLIVSGKGVFEGLTGGIKLAMRDFNTTLLLFLSLCLIIALIGWIPLFGALVIIPYTVITYSIATRELSGYSISRSSLRSPKT